MSVLAALVVRGCIGGMREDQMITALARARETVAALELDMARALFDVQSPGRLCL